MKKSAAGHDLDDLQAVAGLNLAGGEFRRGDRLAIVLYHDAARQKVLSQEKLLQGAGEVGLDLPAIGGDVGLVQGVMRMVALKAAAAA